MKSRAAQGQEILTELLLRIVQELGPSQGKELLARAGAADWGLEFGVERLDQEVLIGLARRKALSKVARDVERCLGKPRRHAQAEAARGLLRGPLPPSRSGTMPTLGSAKI